MEFVNGKDFSDYPIYYMKWKKYVPNHQPVLGCPIFYSNTRWPSFGLGTSVELQLEPAESFGELFTSYVKHIFSVMLSFRTNNLRICRICVVHLEVS